LGAGDGVVVGVGVWLVAVVAELGVLLAAVAAELGLWCAAGVELADQRSGDTGGS
jgi:hypothetical protein